MRPPGDDDSPLGRVIPLPGFTLPGALSPAPSRPRDDDGDLDAPDDLRPRPPEPAQLAAAAEAVLFSVSDPIPLGRLAELLDGPDDADLKAALTLVQVRYQRAGHGLRLVEVAGGWQLRTHPRFARWCARARAAKPVRMSRAALETLAVVAYEQPVTRSEVEQIRGVDPGAILRGLVERGLVRTVGHRDEPGRPLLYGTTAAFLEIFGLRDLSDLPTLRDLRELKEDDPEASLDSGLVDDVPDEEDALAEGAPPDGELPF
ncbi:MAG: SMC-Scp complex subunit ScpB [Pseudomonadota bacterium]